MSVRVLMLLGWLLISVAGCDAGKSDLERCTEMVRYESDLCYKKTSINAGSGSAEAYAELGRFLTNSDACLSEALEGHKRCEILYGN
jgi:hypothetical protein